MNPAPTFAADLHAQDKRISRDLAIAYGAIYDLAYTTKFTNSDPIVRGRQARRLAVDAIASSVAGDGRITQPGRTPADEAASKAAAEAMNAGPQNYRVLFAYRDAYWAAHDAQQREKTGNSDQAAGIAALAVACAVNEKIAADESAGSNAADDRSAAKDDDNGQTARDQHPAAYDAAYKAAYRTVGSDSVTQGYDRCMAAYEAVNLQSIRDHAERNQRLMEDLAIKALYDAGHDWAAKRPHLIR